MKTVFSFIKKAQWLRLVFFFVPFTVLGIALSFFYNLVGNLYFGLGAKVFSAFLFGIILMVFTRTVRRLFRIHNSLLLFYTVLGALVVIHFFRWSFHITWLRSFDWTVGGLHPIGDFVGFVDYFLQITNEARLPGMHLVSNMFRFNDIGWVLEVYDFSLSLRGWLLSLVWIIEMVAMSILPMIGAFKLKEIYLPNHYNWAKFEKLPYPFEKFTEEDLEKITQGKLELITERTFAEGDVFSQIGLVYSGKVKTEYITFYPAKLRKKRPVYGPPCRLIPIGLEEVEKIEKSLKETHAAFFKKEEKDENPGMALVEKIAKSSGKKGARSSKAKADKILVAKRGMAFSEKNELVEGFKPINRNVRGRRQPDGTYELPKMRQSFHENPRADLRFLRQGSRPKV